MAETAYIPRLRAEYDKSIRGKLTEQFGYANLMEVPRLDKVVLNMGVGEAVNDRKKAELAAADLSLIAGQKAVVTYSRIAIATYKLRENQPIGLQGHAAQGQDVRVHRSPRERRATPRARLPRP